MYEILKDFQSALVGILGFTGVVMTLWWNARLARAARKDLVQHTRLTLEVAIREELRAIEAQLLAVKSRLSSEEGVTPYISFFEPDVYKALLKDIGVLRADQIRPIVQAHANLVLVRRGIAMVARETDDGLLDIRSGEEPRVRSLIEWGLSQTREAIEALS